jgi:hypothetical protein
MTDFVAEFAVFVLQMMVVYVVIQVVINYFVIRAMTAQIQEHIESRAIPVTVEFDNNQFYCYNKQNKEFLAQGSTYEEIKTQLQARCKDCLVYIDGGDPEVVDRLLKQKTQ